MLTVNLNNCCTSTDPTTVKIFNNRKNICQLNMRVLLGAHKIFKTKSQHTKSPIYSDLNLHIVNTYEDSYRIIGA
jgi:hypothetical protein